MSWLRGAFDRCLRMTVKVLSQLQTKKASKRIKHVSTQPFTSAKDPEFTNKKHKKPSKGDKISEALSTFADV